MYDDDDDDRWSKRPVAPSAPPMPVTAPAAAPGKTRKPFAEMLKDAMKKKPSARDSVPFDRADRRDALKMSKILNSKTARSPTEASSSQTKLVNNLSGTKSLVSTGKRARKYSVSSQAEKHGIVKRKVSRRESMSNGSKKPSTAGQDDNPDNSAPLRRFRTAAVKTKNRVKKQANAGKRKQEPKQPKKRRKSG